MVADAGNGRRPIAGQRTEYQPLDKASVSFDVDGDGKDEVIPFRQLEELAGEAFYTADGQRLVPNQPAKVASAKHRCKRIGGSHHCPASVPNAQCVSCVSTVGVWRAPDAKKFDLFGESGEPRRNRTFNPQIKSLLLCQLS
jgi:hypothetical protein